ncbi:hypothetical protein K456DRAFT_729608 [Colletotrichum gloeosporioides 23]|nr:hypothetical protein K456DRAFT_729608 [Colletotrichum gloeosporioides 23]
MALGKGRTSGAQGVCNRQSMVDKRPGLPSFPRVTAAGCNMPLQSPKPLCCVVTENIFPTGLEPFRAPTGGRSKSLTLARPRLTCRNSQHPDPSRMPSFACPRGSLHVTLIAAWALLSGSLGAWVHLVTFHFLSLRKSRGAYYK